jgi:Asp-tRNA(Asn)/Glu-tRNA(Gln) amidotransferase A subunit family amidase
MERAPASALPWLGAREAARRIAAGEISSEQLVAACLERIAGREPVIRAWAHLDPGAALEQARARDAERPRGPLHGVPVAVKDIADTADLPTEWGTPIHAGRRPQRDAACVARLRAAGAVVLGKTVTTEMATYEPPPTRNPADPAHTPGGSSSGSAAAVADGMVALAIGSQTAGSVIRPAAFCGVLGLKPTRGLLDLSGVMGLSPRLDTLGFFAREAADLELLGAVLSDAWDPVSEAEADRAPSVVLCRTPWWDHAGEDTRRALERTAERLAAAGAVVRELHLPPTFTALPQAHDTLMAFDTARTRAWEYEHHAAQLSDRLREYMERGLATPPEDAEEAVRLGAACAVELESLLRQGEVLLVPAAVGEAPLLTENSTGDPLFCRPWSLLGTPALSVPGATGARDLPVGVQLVAPAGRDRALRAAGAWAAPRLA